jgi:glycosyltransferase involved in cell wall biosynthesis
MSSAYAFFIGNNTAYNIQRLLRNLGAMLHGEYQLDLITTNPAPLSSEVEDYFDVYGGPVSENVYGECQSLKRYLAGNTPKAITQLTEPPSHGTITGILARRHGVPCIYRYSGDRFGVYQTYKGLNKLAYFGYNNLLGRVPLQLADRFIVLGRTGQSRLVQRGIPSDQVTILPPAIQRDRFSPDQQPATIQSVPADRRVVLFVGRLSRHKGIKTMERIIPTVLRERSDIQFVFVGNPVRDVEVAEPYKDNVTVVGRVPPSEMPNYYARADVLVHPSLTEGLPLVLIEALLTGTPVIARPVGDIPDITANTFTTESELVQMICDFESLPMDDGYKYSCEYLKSKYIEFYRAFR